MGEWAAWAAAAVAIAGLILQWLVTRSQHRSHRATSLLEHRLRSCLELTDAVGEVQRLRGPLAATARQDGWASHRSDRDLEAYNAAVSRVHRTSFEVRLTMPESTRLAADRLVERVIKTFSILVSNPADLADGPWYEQLQVSIGLEDEALREFEAAARTTLQSIE